MTYTPNIPQATDYIDESQPIILANFQALDTYFDVDHYKFSAVSDNGKHRSVTTPDQGSHQSTSADEPAFYAYEAYSALGVLQWSRGGSDATPTPVTALHGLITTLTTTPVDLVDFAGFTRAFGELFAGDDGVSRASIVPIAFNGTQIVGIAAGGDTLTSMYSFASASDLVITRAIGSDAVNKTKLQIAAVSGSYSNVAWTIKLHRAD